jgi:hypothetical protein
MTVTNHKPFAEILGEVMAKSKDKSDRVIPAKEFVGGLKRMGDVWGIETENSGTFTMTKPALVQLVKDRLGGMPALFNDRDVSERTVQNYMMDKVLAGQVDKPLALRVTGTQIDGVLSDHYAFFDNTRLMLTLAGFVRDGLLPEQLYAHRYYVGPGARDLHLRLISPENWNFKNGDQYYGSVLFSNNELGLASLKVAPAIARVACFNYLVAENTIQANHTFGSVEELDKTILQGVQHIQRYAASMFERIQHSHAVQFDRPETVFTMVAREMHLPQYVEEKARAWWVQEGEENSLWAIVQAVVNGTQELTPNKGKKVRWDDRNAFEHNVWMWSENILTRHQEGQDINKVFSSAELVQKSKVLEILRGNQQWQPARELVATLEPVAWTEN